MATIAPAPPVTTAFPKAAVEQCLLDELVEAIKAVAKIKGTPLPTGPGQVRMMPVQVDSLVCVDILCAIEPILKIELPESVVRAGGYGSIDSAIANLVPRIQKEWIKKGGKP
ncbi:hypothetical protein [Sphingomonas sp. CARO-RG-8B-R24-01]|uniref:hypothetical protein n=1 Tax=Sphingomonas sp. CARO-RG-8B-R24-01 TaxID=2914831 RepID=UPI001F58ABA3|nr:hypothetical protein [Sphingomonas sp. CARO-RG-8B-R24-01]